MAASQTKKGTAMFTIDALIGFGAAYFGVVILARFHSMVQGFGNE